MLPALFASALADTPAPQAVIVYGSDQAADTALLPAELQEPGAVAPGQSLLRAVAQ